MPDPAAPEMSTQYDHAEVEPRWAEVWVERGYFRAEVDASREPYCIVTWLSRSR
jgi:valyl-tRNA synthetase